MARLDLFRYGDQEGTVSQETGDGREAGFIRTYWKVSLILLVALISVIIILNRGRLAEFGRYGYFGVFLISLLGNATIIVPAPSLAVVFAMGSALNPGLVGLAAGAGEALGELSGFLAGYGGRTVIERTDIYERFRRAMERYGLFAIFVLSVIPTPFFDLAGLAAGALRFPLWQFLLVCWVGKTIKTMLIAFIGAGSGTLLDQWLQ